MKCLFVWLLCLLPVAGLCLDRQPYVGDFEKADSIAVAYANHSLFNLDLLASRLTSALHSDETKFRAIYKWVCDNISYDRSTYLENKRMRAKLSNEALEAWNARVTLKVFRELVSHRRTVCTGYAWLVKELAQRAGLACMVIDGYGRNITSNVGGQGIPNHSWNAVQLNGRWYLCDATWSAGGIDVNSGVFVAKFNDAYFLADPAIFIRNHYPLDPQWSLMNQTPSLQWFLHGPLLYTAALQYGVQPVGSGEFEIRATRGDTVTIAFTILDPAANHVMLHIGNQLLEAITVNICNTGAKEIVFRYRCRNRGIFAANVMVNTNWVVGYKILVK
jgi:hypothetical protein